MYNYSHKQTYYGKTIFCPWAKFIAEVNHIMMSLFKGTDVKWAVCVREGPEWHIAIYANLDNGKAREQTKERFLEVCKQYGAEADAEKAWEERASGECNHGLHKIHMSPEVSEGIISERYCDFPIDFSLATEEGILFAEKVNLLKKNFTVHTPDGTLLARASGDEEYPSITVELLREHGNVTLAMVEYIPGGEGIADYDPEHFERMREQIDSIPKQRIMHQDGSPLTENDYVAVTLDNLKEYRVTAGLVTRTWPDEVNAIEYHRDTYHTGYKKTNNNKEEK